MRVLCAAIAVLCTATWSYAGGCRAKTVVTQVATVVTPVVPVIQAVTIPLYSYSYAPPAQQNYQAAEAAPDCCERLVGELAKLRAEVAALRGGSPSAGVPILSIMASRCASCHTAGQKPQGELELFGADGKRTPLSITVKNRIRRRVTSGDMPRAPAGAPHAPLTPAEQAQLFKELDSTGP